MIKSITFFIFLLFIAQNSVHGQSFSFTQMFYNVENLFDTVDNLFKNDNSFLPTSKKNWNSFKLQRKLSQIASVIRNIDDKGSVPQLVALAEVENEGLIQKLILHKKLLKTAYKTVYFESDDKRGIDIALLYDDKYLELKHKRLIQVKEFATRGIVEAVFRYKPLDICFAVFANHWPSRYGGQAKSDPKRMLVSSKLIQAIKGLVKRLPKIEFVSILGDFNDSPHSPSVQQLAKANLAGYTFENSLAGKEDQGVYTLQYRSKGFLFDQIMLFGTKTFFDKTNRFVQVPTVANPRFGMFFRTLRNHKIRIKRTYEGKRYIGGVSDHLPVMMRIEFDTAYNASSLQYR